MASSSRWGAEDSEAEVHNVEDRVWATGEADEVEVHSSSSGRTRDKELLVLRSSKAGKAAGRVVGRANSSRRQADEAGTEDSRALLSHRLLPPPSHRQPKADADCKSQHQTVIASLPLPQLRPTLIFAHPIVLLLPFALSSIFRSFLALPLYFNVALLPPPLGLDCCCCCMWLAAGWFVGCVVVMQCFVWCGVYCTQFVLHSGCRMDWDVLRM